MAEGSGIRVCALLAVVFAASGCQTVIEHVGVALYYEHAALPESQQLLDLPYRDDPDADPRKHRLDLFLPAPGVRDWPVLVFVHGGGWTEGDRAVEAAGESILRNIGRYFASRGVGAAVISYRLQPRVGWRDQIRDVADATRFVRDRVSRHGGDPDALYLSGHSAGAWLAAKTGFDPQVLEAAGVPAFGVCGLALVSGGAYDLTDGETFALGASRAFFVEHFDDGSADWERAASVVPLVRSTLPPTLVIYGDRDPARLRRQSDLLFAALADAGAPVDRVVAPGEGHQSIVLTLSRGDKTTVPAILALIEEAPCPRSPEALENPIVPDPA